MKKELRKLNKTFAIFSIILLIISGILMSLSFTFAQTTLPGYTAMPDRDTWTEVGLSPDFVGVNQEITVNIMTYPGPSGPTYEAQYLVPEIHGGFEGISITIKHPDGYEETFMPIDETIAQTGVEIPGTAQIVGHLQFRYTPTKVGQYTFTASFPGDFYTTDNIYKPGKLSVYYKPSQSTKPAILTVQEEKVIEAGLLTGWPWSPLPEGYWEEPVDTDNREWHAISGDWTQQGYNIEGSNYNPYSTAPNSPHIVWATEVGMGGLPGGFFGSLPYDDGGNSYIILEGRIYRSGRSGYFNCYDLRTGELLWEAPGSVTLAQRLDPAYQTEAQLHEGGISAWLWRVGASRTGTGPDKWYRYDPYDGDLLQTITNVPRDISGLKFQDGSSIAWVVQSDLSKWNTTDPMKIPYANLIKWDYNQMQTTIVYSNIYSNDWADGIVWNVSVKTDDVVSVGDNNFRGLNVYPYWEANVVVVKTPNAMQQSLGVDMDTGQILWKNYNMVLDIDVRTEGVATSPSGPLLKQDGGGHWVAYDVKTGREIWKAPTGELPWALLPAYTFVYNNGVIFAGSYDGYVYAYNKDNGNVIWQSDYVGEQWETIYGNQPFNGMAVGADGKLYYSTDTTYRMMPRTRLHELICIDEYTGKFIWRLPIGIEASSIADGYVVGTDTENGIMYAIGKGKTEISVTAPDVAVPKGTAFTIKGSIMDMSPGTPNTPAVSDEDMSEWMDYMYGQNATLLNNPPTPTGVPVKLSYQMADGNWQDIGEVTSDAFGNFALSWTPSAEGKYAIKAFFLGSESYFSSAETTYVTVGPAPASGGEIEPEPTPEHPIISTELAIAIGVIVVAVVAAIGYVVYKRRK